MSARDCSKDVICTDCDTRVGAHVICASKSSADGGGSKGPADDTSCTCLILSDMIAFRVGGDLTRAMCPPFQDGNHKKHNVR